MAQVMKLLIAIPARNESKHLLRVIDRISEFVDHILVIDDGSTDDSPDLLKQRPAVKVIRHPTNLGYGKSLIDAFGHAQENGFDWVLTMDADGQHEAADIPDFIQQIQTDQFDLISGSRYLAHRNEDDIAPPDRRDINKRITKIVNTTLGLSITDAFCGFKAHRTKCMIDLQLTEFGYAFPLQLWPRVAEHRLKLVELPVRRIYNDPNRSFGKQLDVAQERFKHYLGVFNAELSRMGRPTVQASLNCPAESCMGVESQAVCP
jgi:glycosyltransferase involved in cell wall biosynthesis